MLISANQSAKGFVAVGERDASNFTHPIFLCLNHIRLHSPQGFDVALFARPVHSYFLFNLSNIAYIIIVCQAMKHEC
jgi:hypothetical protein